MRALLFMIALLVPVAPAFAQNDTAAKARAVLETNCYRCHGKAGASEGGFSFALDAAKLAEKKKIVAGSPEKSKLFLRMNAPENDSDTMPPESEKPRPSKEDIAIVAKWIRDGAGAFPEPKRDEPKREFLDEKYVYKAMRDYLVKHADDAHYIRFITLTVQHNSPAARVTGANLRLYRAGIAKLLNSLSWKRTLVFPKPIDPAEVVLALDLRDLDWDLNDGWRRIIGHTAQLPKDDFHPGYPYALSHDRYPDDSEFNEIAKEVYQRTGTRIPAIRADWLLATASVPPLYHELLNLPTTQKELEASLKVDRATNFRRGAIARVAFNESGVSAQANRMFERHDSTYGYYYPSYDFRSGDGRGNLIRFPLGPLNLFPEGKHPFADFAFVHDGGELIFSLPNGLQAYMLVKGDGGRINDGPPDVVRDTKETAGKSTLIVNGLSCMACHKDGMITGEKVIDAVRSGSALQGDALLQLKKLYPSPKRMDTLMKQDEELFLDTLDRVITPYLRVGPDKTKEIRLFPEPVSAIASPFIKSKLTLEEAALEMGFKDPKELKIIIEHNSRLSDDLSFKTLITGGTIRREVWQSPRERKSPFQEAMLELKRGTPEGVGR